MKHFNKNQPVRVNMEIRTELIVRLVVVKVSVQNVTTVTKCKPTKLAVHLNVLVPTELPLKTSSNFAQVPKSTVAWNVSTDTIWTTNLTFAFFVSS